jgi:NDP-sugar pyrophosphorylase family protein
MNGDSYTDVDLDLLARNHGSSSADVTVVVIPETRSDAGSVILDRNGKVITFSEKQVVPGSRYLSAGIYMLEMSLATTIPQSVKISLEEKLFPQWLADGRDVEGFIFEGRCLDIGTPERFRKVQGLLEKIEAEPIMESEGQS